MTIPSAIAAMVAPLAVRRAVEMERMALGASEVTGQRVTADDLAALGRCFDRCHDRDLTHGRWLAWCRVCGYHRPLTRGERA